MRIRELCIKRGAAGPCSKLWVPACMHAWVSRGGAVETSASQSSSITQVYEAGVHPQFPDGGKMSVHLDSLAIGDTIEAKGVYDINNNIIVCMSRAELNNLFQHDRLSGVAMCAAAADSAESVLCIVVGSRCLCRKNARSTKQHSREARQPSYLIYCALQGRWGTSNTWGRGATTWATRRSMRRTCLSSQAAPASPLSCR